MDMINKNELVDVCVLSLLKKEGSYGYYIWKSINEYAEVTEAALYCILKRMEQDGLIKTYSMEYSNRLRKYYSLTETGTKKVDDFLKKWEEVAQVYNFIVADRSEKKRRWL